MQHRLWIGRRSYRFCSTTKIRSHEATVGVPRRQEEDRKGTADLKRWRQENVVEVEVAESMALCSRKAEAHSNSPGMVGLHRPGRWQRTDPDLDLVLW